METNLTGKWCVVVNENVYGLNPPFDNCKIIQPASEIPSLHERVFCGTYEECTDYARENCKNTKESKTK